MSYNYAAHHHTQPPQVVEFPYWPAQPHSFHSADQPWQQSYQFGVPLWEEPALHSQPPGPNTQPWQQPPDPPDWQQNPQQHQQSASQEPILAVASLESRWDYIDRHETEGRPPLVPDISPPYSGPETWYHGYQPEYHHPQVQNQFAHDTPNTRHSGGFQQSHVSSPNLDGQLSDPYYQWDEYQQHQPPYVLQQPHRQYPNPYGCLPPLPHSPYLAYGESTYQGSDPNNPDLMARSLSPAQLAAVNDYNEKLRVYRLDQAALLARVTAWFEENIDDENVTEVNIDNTPTMVLSAASPMLPSTLLSG